MAIPGTGYAYEADGATDDLLHYWPNFDIFNEDLAIDTVSAMNLVVEGANPANTLVTVTDPWKYVRDLTVNGLGNLHNWLKHDSEATPFVPIDDWTLAIWFYPDTLTYANLPYLLNMLTTEGFSVYFTNPGAVPTINIEWANGNLSTVTDTVNLPTVTAWNLLVIQSDFAAGSVSVYLNNTLLGTDTNGYQPLDLHNQNWVIGGSTWDSADTKYFDGKVDEVAIWNRVIDGTDRTTLYNAGAGIELVQYANDHRVIVAETAAFSETARYSFGLVAADIFSLSETEATKLNAVGNAADDLGVNEALIVTYRPRAIAGDGITLAESIAANLRAGLVASDKVNFVAALNVEGDVYLGIVMNTNNAAVTEYLNYNFDSMAKTGANEFMASGADGIYRLEGSDDAGTQIDSYITTKLFHFGSEQFKRVERAYIALRNTGTLVLKTITRDRQGQRVENWYELEEVDDTIRQRRIKIGKGLKSHYWQFTLMSNAGADFEIDNLEFVPIILTRRV
jgi:hypothetical protein